VFAAVDLKRALNWKLTYESLEVKVRVEALGTLDSCATDWTVLLILLLRRVEHPQYASFAEAVTTHRHHRLGKDFNTDRAFQTFGDFVSAHKLNFLSSLHYLNLKINNLINCSTLRFVGFGVLGSNT